MKKFALIVAGGRGKRMDNTIHKQFLELSGKPILMHTIETFYNYDKNIEIILILPENQINSWELLCKKIPFSIKTKITAGGDTRFRSVKNGLEMIKEEGIVFIHDGVRPFVSHETIKNCEKTAIKFGNALPVIPVSESLRKLENQTSESVDRSQFFLVQTPQTFQTHLIINAYNQTASEEFTDDASVLEHTGATIHLVEGNRENIKITYPQDYLVAEAFLHHKS